MILKYTGLGKHPAPPSVQISQVTDGQYKGQVKVDYKGKTYYMPPSEVQHWLQQQGLAPSTATTSPSPAPSGGH